MRDDGRRWEGGRIHRQKDGRPLYLIERMVGGVRYSLSTRTHTRRAALEHLDRFERDPQEYLRRMREGPVAGVAITVELIDQFADWLSTRDRPAVRPYVNGCVRRLGDWLEDLRGADLRRVTLAELKACVDKRKTCRRQRIIALKSFCSWLRTEKYLLTRQNDASMDLPVPQAVPEKHVRRKAVELERVRKAAAHLGPAYRDCLILLAKVGWHVTELERFARDESSRIAEGRGPVLAVLQVRHKTGATTRTPITSAAVLAAARRIKMRGTLPRRMNDALRRACASAGVEPFGFGVLRHSVATWAIEDGSAPEVVADFLGHRSKSTTLRFYADVAVPTATVNVPDL